MDQTGKEISCIIYFHDLTLNKTEVNVHIQNIWWHYTTSTPNQKQMGKHFMYSRF
jgi:hypothetical protein